MTLRRQKKRYATKTCAHRSLNAGGKKPKADNKTEFVTHVQMQIYELHVSQSKNEREHYKKQAARQYANESEAQTKQNQRKTLFFFHYSRLHSMQFISYRYNLLYGEFRLYQHSSPHTHIPPSNFTKLNECASQRHAI